MHKSANYMLLASLCKKKETKKLYFILVMHACKLVSGKNSFILIIYDKASRTYAKLLNEKCFHEYYVLKVINLFKRNHF